VALPSAPGGSGANAAARRLASLDSSRSLADFAPAKGEGMRAEKGGRRRGRRWASAMGVAAAAWVLAPAPALAAEGVDGAAMSLLWALPFVGLLLSIATGPLLYPHLWEHHYPKFALFWAACTVVPLFVSAGAPAAGQALLHTLLLEYLPFILLLIALFATAGG